MHNEGAPRHHAGAPGPFLYLKRRSERVRSRAQRIRSPGSLSPEKPPPREAREPLLSRRAEFPVFTVSPGKSSPEPRPGSPRAEGEGVLVVGVGVGDGFFTTARLGQLNHLISLPRRKCPEFGRWRMEKTGPRLSR